MSFDGDLYPEAGATSVLTTKGDIVRYNSARERYGIGSANQILQVKSSLPSWETVDLADTDLTTAGDILYENATPELARLPKGSDADVLTLASGLPSWAAPAGGGAWSEILSEDAGSTDATSSVFAAKNYLDIQIFASDFTTAGNNMPNKELNFNASTPSDGNTDYSQTAMNLNDIDPATERVSQPKIILRNSDFAQTTDAMYYGHIILQNFDGYPKTFNWMGAQYNPDPAVVVYFNTGYGYWDDTTQVTKLRFGLTSGRGTFTKTNFVVLGHD